MALPGNAAEASLYRTSGSYRGARSGPADDSGLTVVAQQIDCGALCAIKCRSATSAAPQAAARWPSSVWAPAAWPSVSASTTVLTAAMVVAESLNVVHRAGHADVGV